MNLKRLYANAKRILLQLKHDPRTLALIIVAPALLMTIIKWIFTTQIETFQHVAASLLGIFPMLIMFLITSVATLRERTSGTLERMMISPISKLEFILGYAIAFGLLSFFQGSIISLYAYKVLGLKIKGSAILLLLIAVLDALIGMALGLLVSSFATTEFQAIQFMPVFLLPQLLISGALIPRIAMPRALYDISNYLPLSYATDATNKLISLSGSVRNDLILLLFFIIFILVLGSFTLRRSNK
jgi:ABC-2 type transport system permease protein